MKPLHHNRKSCVLQLRPNATKYIINKNLKNREEREKAIRGHRLCAGGRWMLRREVEAEGNTEALNS